MVVRSFILPHSQYIQFLDQLVSIATVIYTKYNITVGHEFLFYLRHSSSVAWTLAIFAWRISSLLHPGYPGPGAETLDRDSRRDRNPLIFFHLCFYTPSLTVPYTFFFLLYFVHLQSNSHFCKTFTRV